MPVISHTVQYFICSCVCIIECVVHVCALLSVLVMCVHYWECVVHVCALLSVLFMCVHY